MTAALLTIAEAAERLAVSQDTVRGLPIARVVLGRSVRFDPADIDAYVARQKRLPSEPERIVPRVRLRGGDVDQYRIPKPKRGAA